MEGLGLTAFDAVALAVVLISAVMAFARGLIREVFSIVAFFAAIFAAIWGYPIVAPYLEGAVGSAFFATLFSGFLIFLAVFVAITILTTMLAKAAHSSDEIGFEGDHIEIIFFFLFVFIPAAIFINDFCFRM